MKKSIPPKTDTVGRGMKVERKKLSGTVAAVDWLLSLDETAWMVRFRNAERIADAIKDVPLR